MRRTGIVFPLILGVVGIGGIVFAQRAGVGPSWQTPSAVTAGVATQGLTAVATNVEGRYQQLILVDPVQRAIAVYHVKLDSGQIELKSVRNVNWDLQLVEFNGQRPLPQEIQSVVTGARP